MACRYFSTRVVHWSRSFWIDGCVIFVIPLWKSLAELKSMKPARWSDGTKALYSYHPILSIAGTIAGDTNM